LRQQAVEDYAAAAARYPNFSFLHAELAWARHVAGDDAGAKEAAAEALRLDALCPHEDKRLKAQMLSDPGLTPLQRIVPLETTMRRLAQKEPADK
jgi:hypothetical protein